MPRYVRCRQAVCHTSVCLGHRTGTQFARLVASDIVLPLASLQQFMPQQGHEVDTGQVWECTGLKAQCPQGAQTSCNSIGIAYTPEMRGMCGYKSHCKEDQKTCGSHSQLLGSYPSPGGVDQPGVVFTLCHVLYVALLTTLTFGR